MTEGFNYRPRLLIFESYSIEGYLRPKIKDEIQSIKHLYHVPQNLATVIGSGNYDIAVIHNFGPYELRTITEAARVAQNKGVQMIVVKSLLHEGGEAGNAFNPFYDELQRKYGCEVLLKTGAEYFDELAGAIHRSVVTLKQHRE